MFDVNKTELFEEESGNTYYLQPWEERQEIHIWPGHTAPKTLGISKVARVSFVC